MADKPPPGTFKLYPYANPPLPAGAYTLTGEVGGLPGEVETLHSAIDITAPRYALPPDQILSTFPPSKARGSFTTRLPQIVLRRRTLAWERSEFAADGTPLDDLDEQTRAETTPRPWLALVLIAEGEGSLFSDVPVGESLTPPVRLDGEADVAKTTCLEVPEKVVRDVFPAVEDLPMLCHLREVDLADTELALGDDDGWMAVVLCNRLPQPNTRYTACLVNLEGQYAELPVRPPVEPAYVRVSSVMDLAVLAEAIDGSHRSADAAGMGLPPATGQALTRASLLDDDGPARAAGGLAADVQLQSAKYKVLPQAATTGAGWAATAGVPAIAAESAIAHTVMTDLSVIGTGIGVVLPWHLVVRTLRFPVLASWSFECTERGDFQYLAQNVNSRLLGHVATPGETPDGGPPDPARRELPAEPSSERPLPLVAATGHVETVHETRRGEVSTAWFRGALGPTPVERAGARSDGRFPLAHHADQLRRVTPDGREDLTYAGAFEIGRLLALSRPSVVAALNRWRRQRFAAATAGAVAEHIASVAPAVLGELLMTPDPFADRLIAGESLPGPPPPDDPRRGAGAGRRFARGLLAALGDEPADLADVRPLADPGFAVDDAALFTAGRDSRLATGLALPDGIELEGDRLWAAPVAVGRRDVSADVAAARLELEDAAAHLAEAAETLATRLRDADAGPRSTR